MYQIGPYYKKEGIYYYVIVNVQFEKGIRDIFVGVFVSSCVSNEKQTHPQKYL